MKTKLVIGILAILLVAIGWKLIIKNSSVSEGKPIKIGVIGAYTGSQAVYGEGAREGIALGAKEFAEKRYGGHSLQFVYEDSTGDVKTAVSAAQKLVNVDGVVMLVSAGASQEAVAIAPVAESLHVPLYTVGSQSKDLTDAGDYVFRGLPTLARLGETIATVAYQNGYRKAATLNATYNPAAVDSEKSFNDVFTALGGKIVARENYVKNTADFRTELTRIREAKPDVLFLNVLSGDGAAVLKQKEELGLKIPMVSHGGVEDQGMIDSAGSATDGIIFATYNAFPPENFSKKIDEMYRKPVRRWNLEGYDTVLFIDKALSGAKSYDREGVREALANTHEYEGVASLIRFDEKGNGERDVVLKLIKGGKIIPYVTN